MDRARLLVSNCWVKNSCSFMPILMRSGVVEREMITWKTSHCRSPWTKISLGAEKAKEMGKVRDTEADGAPEQQDGADGAELGFCSHHHTPFL